MRLFAHRDRRAPADTAAPAERSGSALVAAPTEPTAPVQQPLNPADAAGWIDSLAAELSTPSLLKRGLNALLRPKAAGATPRAALELLRLWPLMSADAKATAFTIGVPAWPAAISESLISTDAHSATGAITLVAERGLIDHAPAVCALIGDERPTVNAAARSAVERLTRDAATFGPADRRTLCVALLGAVESFDRHRAWETLSALARLSATDPGAWRHAAESAPWLQDASHPAVLVMRTLLRKSAEPYVLPAAWRWMNEPALAAAAAARVLSPRPGDPRQWLMEQMHLCRSPRRAEAITTAIRQPARPITSGPAAGRQPDRQGADPMPSMDVLCHLPAPARAMAPAWASLVRPSSEDLDAALTAFIADPSPLVRLNALRAAINAQRPPSCLMDFCFDAHEPIALLAADTLLARPRGDDLIRSDRERLARTLLRSPHASVRIAAEQALARPEPRRAGDVRLIEPTLAAPRSARQLVAMIEDRLHASDQPIDRPLAAAAAALATCDHPEADRLAADLTRHADPRVRSNAVETLTRRALARRSSTPMSAPQAEALALAVADEHHRVRSTAARWQLTLAAAAGQPSLAAASQSTLTIMLRDARPMHKRAALWAVTRCCALASKPQDMVDACVELTHSADPAVALAAKQAADRLAHEIRRRWSLKAAPIAQPTSVTA